MALYSALRRWLVALLAVTGLLAVGHCGPGLEPPSHPTSSADPRSGDIGASGEAKPETVPPADDEASAQATGDSNDAPASASATNEDDGVEEAATGTDADTSSRNDDATLGSGALGGEADAGIDQPQAPQDAAQDAAQDAGLDAAIDDAGDADASDDGSTADASPDAMP